MLDFDSAAHTGRQYSYCTYGIAVSEIELDTLTGQHKLLETEILMDVGRSLNPRIDIGQIEGAFTQDEILFKLRNHSSYSNLEFIDNRNPLRLVSQKHVF